MRRYFFHLRDGSDVLLDPEGIELPNLEAVRKLALKAARDVLSHDIKEGHINLRYRIDAEDGQGKVVYSLPLRETFAVTE